MKLHVELTNRCTLKCPGCPRTQWQQLLRRPIEKNDLDMHDLYTFLDCPGGRAVDQFVLCGDYGDPIYYPGLFDFLKLFRDTKRYVIVTNGSHKNEKFWTELSGILGSQDLIMFSIDGLEDTNHLYRINSEWNDIMLGLDIMSNSACQVTWKTIIFNHNYQQLDRIKQLAYDKGCNFTAEKTHRFGNNDLRPPEQFVENNHVYNDAFAHDHSIEIVPSCMSEKTVSCDGYLYPCDWIRNPRTFYKSQLWKHREKWLDNLNIRQSNFDQAMTVVQDWTNWVRESSLNHSAEVPTLCRMKCRRDCGQNRYVDV